METSETILLAEALLKHAEVMATHLKDQKFNVVVSVSLEQTKELLVKQLPDMLVVDLNISGEESLDFYRWMLSIPEISRIPRLFIAGKLQTEIARKLEKEYKETVLIKPLDINRFTSTLTRLKSGKSPLIRKYRAQDYFSSLIGKKVGPATILEEIGRGGMGAVFLGRQESLDRHVAIKVLLPEMAGDFTAIERFQREALAIARLKSPHVVQIYDFGEYETNAFYICMEYLHGQTVDQYLKRNGSFPLEKAISVIMQVAAGLSTAHDAGLIHRDIKPSNLIMDNKGHVTITDFGLVRPQKKLTQTQSGVIVGSPHYMAPEQMSEVQPDARSDIYSLGIVFFHLVAGQPPFLGTNPLEILMKHLNEPLPNLRNTIPQIPQTIIDILDRMCAKDPNDRYINCRELVWDLKAQERKYTARTGRGPGLGVEQEAPVPAEGLKKVSLDTTFHPILSELQRQSPELFTPENLLGSLTITESGSMVGSQGKFPEEWKNAIFIIHESTKQLNAAVQLGQWKFKLVETPDEVLVVFPLPKGPNLGTLLFNQKDTGVFSSASLKMASASFAGARQKHPADPLNHVASIVGVTDVLLFNDEGQLADYVLKDERVLEQYKLRFPPVVRIIHSISFTITGLDLWFDKGRIMAWKLETGIIFIVGSLDISRSFISIYITAHLEQLNTTTRTTIIPDLKQKQTIETIEKEKTVVSPVPPRLMEQIQLELAHMIGPIAKVVLSKECKKMGYSRGNFPGDELLELVKMLTQRVEESRREQFSDNVQDIIYEFRSKK
jgi:serine/threonine protein kinase